MRFLSASRVLSVTAAGQQRRTHAIGQPIWKPSNRPASIPGRQTCLLGWLASAFCSRSLFSLLSSSPGWPKIDRQVSSTKEKVPHPSFTLTFRFKTPQPPSYFRCSAGTGGGGVWGGLFSSWGVRSTNLRFPLFDSCFPRTPKTKQWPPPAHTNTPVGNTHLFHVLRSEVWTVNGWWAPRSTLFWLTNHITIRS